MGSAIAGLVLGGAMLRQFLTSWIDGRAKLKGSVSPGTTGAIVAGVTIGWSADQIERALQALEKMAGAADFYEDSTREKSDAVMNRLLKHLEKVEQKP